MAVIPNAKVIYTDSPATPAFILLLLELLEKCNAPQNFPDQTMKFSEGEMIMVPTCNSRSSPNSANYSSSIVCSPKGKWNGTFPLCESKGKLKSSCPEPPEIESAIVQRHQPGKKATYICLKGYKPTKKKIMSTLRCKQGKWKGTPINCTRGRV